MCAESLQIQSAIGIQGTIFAYTLGVLARVMFARGEYERAVRLWAAFAAVQENLSFSSHPDAAIPTVAISECKDALGVDLFESAWNGGIGMTREQVIELALGA
jgi:hypothetical protein